MKAVIKLFVISAAMLAATSAQARDTRAMFSIQDALNTSHAQEKMDKGIKLYFGDQKHPKVLKDFGEIRTNKKTNAFGKSDEDACKWVFLSAVLQLQQRARHDGGNAVIDIKSNYKNTVTSSNTQYMCGAGAIIAGVAFKGRVVKLEAH